MNTPAISEPKLTKKERAFLKEYFKTGNGTLSCLKTYNTDNYASASEIASQILRRLKNPMKAYMEANGFSFKQLLSILVGGLTAEKLEDLSGEKVPDHGVRHKYLTTASKWLGIDTDQALLMQQINMEKNNNFRETSLLDEEMPPEVKEWYHSHGLPVPLMGGLTDLRGVIEVTYADTKPETNGKNVVELTNFEKPKEETINVKELSDEELEDLAKTNNS